MKVFVSSTTKDLGEERKAVCERLLQIDIQPVSMDWYAADPKPPRQLDDAKVNECAAFVIIVGHLYGSSPKGEKKSFTELEYEAAITSGKPVYSFLASNKFMLAPNLQESDAKRKKLKAFRECLEREHSPRPFDNADQLCTEVVAALKKLEGIPKTGAVIHNLPYGSMGGLFKGREGVLERLESELGAGKTTAITQVKAIYGLGGIGKTRLAVEYAWHALENGQYKAVFFVVADTEANLNTNLAALASRGLLDLPEQESKEQPVIVEAVLSELGRRKDWLMIFDNVASDEATERLHKRVLPRLAGGKVLITSRRSNWPDEVADLSIDKLNEADAAAYLLEKTEGKQAKSADDETLAKEVARELDGLPIALEQTAAYVCQRHVGFGTYLKDFNKSRKTVLSWDKGQVNYPEAVLSA